MKNRHIGLGAFVLGIGVIWLLINLGVINWSILESLSQLWPLILIVIGINVVFKHNSLVKAITWLVFIAVLTVHGYFYQEKFDDLKLVNAKNFSIEKHVDTKEGELELSLGGLRLDVGPNTANLVEGAVSNLEIGHAVSYSSGNDKAFINIKDDRKKIGIFRGTNNQSCKLDINKDVVWDMDLNIGAVSGELDMRDLKVRKLDVDVGAGEIKLLFGNLYEASQVDINAGASSIDMVIPRDAGVRIDVDGLLSKTNFSDLGWVEHGGYYESPNYDSAEFRLNMDIDIGVGKLSVVLQ